MLLASVEKSDHRVFSAWSEFATPTRDRGTLLTTWEAERIEREKRNGNIAERIVDSMSQGTKSLDLAVIIFTCCFGRLFKAYQIFLLVLLFLL